MKRLFGRLPWASVHRGADRDANDVRLLSIGLAVYNGEKHLRESIDSLLAQDVNDLELVICDNASTDSTQAICLEYVASDSRVTYHRNETNIGAAANYNRVFGLCTGRYFMWGSDDDVWDRRFARKCIKMLETSPDAVMCTSGIEFINDDGSRKGDWRYDSIHTKGMPVEARVHELIRRTGWFATYSVIRPSALRATRLSLCTYGADVRLLLELLLLGDMLSVPETLFRYRVPHTLKTSEDYVAELDPEQTASDSEVQTREPYTYLARELLKVVRDADLGDEIRWLIEEDFVDTLGFENLDWGGRVLREQGIAVDALLSTEATESAMRIALEIDRSRPAPMVSAPHGISRGKPTLLAFFPHNLWPPRSGAHARGLAILRSFVDSGFAVHLVSSTAFTDYPWEQASIDGLRSVGIETTVHELDGRDVAYRARMERRSARRGEHIPWAAFVPPGLLQEFRRVAEATRPVLALSTYAYWAELLRAVPGDDVLRVVDSQDTLVESERNRRIVLGQIARFGTDASLVDASLPGRMEPPDASEEYRRYEMADITLAISRRDAQLIARLAPSTRAVYIPYTTPIIDVENTYAGQPVFVIGNNPFNVQGYVYLATRVLPEMREPADGICVLVAGTGSIGLEERPRTKVVGPVASLSDLYASAPFAVCPLINGTGQQVKIIEAMAHGVPVIAMAGVAASSPIVHGSNGFIARDHLEFAGYCARLYSDRALCRSLGEAAKKTISEGYSDRLLRQRLDIVIAEAGRRLH